MYCKNCGDTLPNNAEYCPSCGVRRRSRKRQNTRQSSQYSYSAPSNNRKSGGAIGGVIKTLVILAFVAALIFFVFAVISRNSPESNTISESFSNIVGDISNIFDQDKSSEGENASENDESNSNNSDEGLTGQKFVNYFNSHTASSKKLNAAVSGKTTDSKIFSGINVGVSTKDNSLLNDVKINASLLGLSSTEAQQNMTDTLTTIFNYLTPNETINASDFGISNVSDVLAGIDITKTFANVTYTAKVSGLSFKFTAKVS